MKIQLFPLIIIYTLIFDVQSDSSVFTADLIRQLPFYSPCTFPVANSGNPIQNREVNLNWAFKRFLINF